MAGQSKTQSPPQSSQQEDLRAKRSRQGRASRRKGQQSEREFFGLLSEELGTCVRRNVDQARNGGADGIEVPGWAIEVKRVESGFQQAWWEQAVRQADAADDCPALAYRASRQAWRIRLMLSDVIWAITRDFPDEADHYQWIECDIPTFALIVRESLPTQETA